MSNVSERARQPVRRQRSIYRVHYALPRQDAEVTRPIAMPTDPREIQAYGSQVAGHSHTENAKYLGLLQSTKGTILKPVIKEAQRREVEFYSRLEVTNDQDLVELRKFVPKYFGCEKFTYNGHTQDYIILEDLTHRMLEPCIMDIKIGRRTWDPLATDEKIKNEQTKYAQCKQEYGFCIPGFQVFQLATGKLLKYNKEYGKKLHGPMVVEALRKFVNGRSGVVCRALVLQLVSQLWRVQRWAAGARPLRLYCASILLVYDAASLRACCADTHAARFKCQSVPSLGSRRRSIHSLHSVGSGSFSGQLSAKGPVYKKLHSVPLTPLTRAHAAFSPPPAIKSPWTEALDKLDTNHSFEHNYEDKLSKMKMNYRATLDQLASDTPKPSLWGTVKIIDFAHAFFNDDQEPTVDDNFREGIDNLVKIFESFLSETQDQCL